MARRGGHGETVGGVAVPRSGRPPTRHVLDLRDHRPADGCAGHRSRRAPAAAVGPAADRDRPRRGAQRTRGGTERRRPGARRLPPGRRARPPRRHDVPVGAPPAARSPGDQQPRRPAPAAGPAAGPRRTGRGPRRRPALHPRRSGGLPQRRHRAWTSAPDDIAALEGRTEGWIAALQLAALSMQGRGRTSAPSSPASRRRPVHRRLPGRGGAGAANRTDPHLPAAHLRCWTG